MSVQRTAPGRAGVADRAVAFGRTIPPVRPNPIALSRRFFQICTSAIADAVEGHGLTPLEYAVLAYLNRINGEPNIDQNGLAARLGIDRNSTSILVEKLVAKGIVAQQVSDADRRARLVRLTPLGERLHSKLRAPTQAGQERILKPLTQAEQKLLIDLLLRVVEGNLGIDRSRAGRRKRSSSQSPSKKV
jgi:MarR family transcriptional regulator, lower aerobic nicotinate degradation pathway regulator